MNPETLLITLLIVGCIAVFMILASRYNARELQHKETLAALEKGVQVPAPPAAPWTPRTYLLSGMIWLFVGLTAMFALFALAATSAQPPSLEGKLHEANLARSSGSTPEEVQMILREAPHATQPIPFGIGFLGLIPVGVGLAYLIFYRVESKKLLS
jgi:hypothetical protein